MISKYEDLRRNAIVVGSELLARLKKKGPSDIENLYDANERSDLGVEEYLNAITFLWIGGFIDVDGIRIGTKVSGS